MKKVMEKHWALIGLVAAFVVDKQFEILPMISDNSLIQEVIKLVGALVVVVIETRGIGGRPDDRKVMQTRGVGGRPDDRKGG